MSDAATPALDCYTTLAHLYPYLDRELAETEQAAVRAHLADCPHCAHLFRFEANVLTCIGQRLAQVQAPDHLRARITRLCQSGR